MQLWRPAWIPTLGAGLFAAATIFWLAFAALVSASYTRIRDFQAAFSAAVPPGSDVHPAGREPPHSPQQIQRFSAVAGFDAAPHNVFPGDDRYDGDRGVVRAIAWAEVALFAALAATAAAAAVFARRAERAAAGGGGGGDGGDELSLVGVRSSRSLLLFGGLLRGRSDTSSEVKPRVVTVPAPVSVRSEAAPAPPSSSAPASAAAELAAHRVAAAARAEAAWAAPVRAVPAAARPAPPPAPAAAAVPVLGSASLPGWPEELPGGTPKWEPDDETGTITLHM